jgi:histidyl-tRNA synthetase
MDLVLQGLGIKPDLKMAVFRLIDRKDKLSFQKWQEFALSLGLTQTNFNGIKDLLDDKDLWKKSESLRRVLDILERIGLGEYISFDPQIIRGLDYYTGVVFEARDMDKEGRAILGGGHYGNLVGDVGGDILPGVGFAMGDVMLRLVLEKYNCLSDFIDTSAKVLVTVFDETLFWDSLEVANLLRKSGVPTILMNEIQKLQKQFKFADRIGVPIVLVLGPDEKNEKQVTVKNLKTGHQENVLLEKLVFFIKDQLA